MPSTTGSTLSGAASGAAAGTAVLPGVGTLIGAGIGAIGGYLSGSGAADSQDQQNKAAAQAAAAQSAQSFLNYLSSRGINIQQVIASDPRGPDFWTNEYAKAKAGGTRDDFNSWFVRAIQAAPSDIIWNTIASPTAGTGAQNTTLPDYAQIGGLPAQPVIADQAGKIFTDQQSANQAQQAQAIARQWAASPSGQNLQNVWNSAPEDYARLYGTFDNFVLADFNANAPPDQKQQIISQASAGQGGVNQTVLTDQQKAVNQNITNLVNGTTLANNLAGLQPALDARTQTAALQQDLINEQRGAATAINTTQLAGLDDLLKTRTTGAGSIYDASVTGAHGISDAALDGLAHLLTTRQQGAQDIYGATVQGAGGVRDAQIQAAQGISAADLAGLKKLLGVQEQGANDVYGAQLLQADTYGQSAEQALQRQLAEQQANRARQGFTGTSSGSDLERARLLSTAIQAGAGARAGAGVTLEQALANARQSNSQQQLQDAINLATGVGAAGTGYASNVGNAGVTRASTVAGAQEQNSLGQLQTGVNLATQLGNAGTTQAATVAGAQEQASAGKLSANTQLATTNAGLLDTNAKIAEAQAKFQNAMDVLNLSIKAQGDQLNASGLPNANASSTLTLQTQQAQSAYDELNALLKTLDSFKIGQASGPALTTSQPGAVLNGSQILGGALTGLGTAVGNTASSYNIADILKALGGSSGTTPPPTAANPYPLGQQTVFLPNAKPTF